MSSSSSSTKSAQTQTTTTQDNRIMAEAGSLNLAASDNNVINATDQSQTTTIYNTLDAGAVGKAFDFAETISKNAASTSVASVGAVSSFGKDAMEAVKDAYGDSAEGVQSAWKQAGSMVADNTKMSISAITSANANTNAQVAEAYKGVTNTLAAAWQDSKAGEQKMLAFGLMAAVALIAVKAVR